jgi:pimeloyl-ACP methyl ester carboxylesterase
MSELAPLDPAVLPPAVRSRFVEGINGLRVHILESGFEKSGRPCVLLLHGFPELAYSWRKVMPPLATAGYHVIAPDLRGYGRTTGWDPGYDADLRPFRLLNAVRDGLGLAFALGYRSVAGVVGHDFGSPVAAWCALVRPDVFRSVVLMSAPFSGPPAIPFDTDRDPPPTSHTPSIHQALAGLDRPRKHYQWYYSTRQASSDLMQCEQGVHAFLRAYYHYKSADWPGNRPFRLSGWTATELAKMPTYYIMDLNETMATTVAPYMPPANGIGTCRWLPDSELAVYTDEFERIGFQGGLNWYRNGTGGDETPDLQNYSGRTIDVPSLFIAGTSDWGVYQSPGAFEAMAEIACTRMQGRHLVDGAGHWVQQEQPSAVADLLIGFLQDSLR